MIVYYCTSVAIVLRCNNSVLQRALCISARTKGDERCIRNRLYGRTVIGICRDSVVSEAVPRAEIGGPFAGNSGARETVTIARDSHRRNNFSAAASFRRCRLRQASDWRRLRSLRADSAAVRTGGGSRR